MMDETAVPVRGGAHYLHRAVDKYGKIVDSLLCTDRNESSARAFFTKALKTHEPRRPRKLNLDGNAASHRALRILLQENPEWRSVVVRSRRYLNNIVEQVERLSAAAHRRWPSSLFAQQSLRSREWNSLIASASASSRSAAAASFARSSISGRVHWCAMTPRATRVGTQLLYSTAVASELKKQYLESSN
jgi:transposase-like protein